MEQGNQIKWLKISRVDSYGRILDVTDPQPQPTVYDPDEEDARIPKYALNYTAYDPKTTQSTTKHRHWVDEPDLLLLAFDLKHLRKGDKDPESGRYRPLIQEYKGGSATAAGIDSLGRDGVVSRTFSVTFTDGLKIGSAYEFRFVMTKGEKADKGQIKPVKDFKPFVDEKMYVTLPIARRFGAQVECHLTAKRTAALVGKYYVDPLWSRLGDKL